MAGSSYQSIFESFSDALTKLNTALYEQEDALNTMLGDASTTVHGDLASYNLDAFAFGDYPSTTVNVAMDASDASIVSTNMKRIETALSDASTQLGSAPASNPTPRDNSVG